MDFRASVRSESVRAWLQIHFCVFLWGFTAILGKAITLPALPLVWWRMTLVTAALLFVPGFWRGLIRMSSRQVATFAGIGMVVALHWLTFYGAIKLSNASVASTCMAVSPLLISIIEPMVVGKSFDWRELFFGIAVVPGIFLIVGGTPAGMRSGIAVGLLSAIFVAIFGSLNKRFVEQAGALGITGLEMGAGSLCLALASAFLPHVDSAFVRPDLHDTILLLVLSLGCTLLPFALSLMALRHLSAFATGLAVNMEPVYAIILAIVLFGEQRELSFTFYIGVAIVFAVVFSHPFIATRRSQSSAR
jgi:drug/metabolite transporter (DMT)-like permease